MTEQIGSGYHFPEAAVKKEAPKAKIDFPKARNNKLTNKEEFELANLPLTIEKLEAEQAVLKQNWQRLIFINKIIN